MSRLRALLVDQRRKVFPIRNTPTRLTKFRGFGRAPALSVCWFIASQSRTMPVVSGLFVEHSGRLPSSKSL